MGVRKDTFASIARPLSQEDQVNYVGRRLTTLFRHLQLTYLPWISELPVDQGMSWVPTWKSVPNSVVSSPVGGRVSSIFLAFGFELAAYCSYCATEFTRLKGIIPPSGVLWEKRIRFPLDPEGNEGDESKVEQDFREKVYQHLMIPNLVHFDIAPIKLGRLSCVIEGGGKRRFIALGNYVTQRLLKPYHDWIMSVLRTIPNDGTYDQEGPLFFLLGCKKCFSFDLKSATDRWPVVVQRTIFRHFFGEAIALRCVIVVLWRIHFV